MREEWLGIENIDTATIYNNIGVCYFKLKSTKGDSEDEEPKKRFEEAIVYIEMAMAILEEFEAHLGANNPRLRMVKSNLERVKRFTTRRLMEKKRGWILIKEKPGKKKGKKGAKGGGKKKK